MWIGGEPVSFDAYPTRTPAWALPRVREPARMPWTTFQSYAHEAVPWLRPVTDTRPTVAAGS